MTRHLKHRVGRGGLGIIALVVWVACNGPGIGAEAAENPSRPLDCIHLTSATEFIEKWYTCGPFSRAGAPELEKQWANDKLRALPARERLAEDRYTTKKGKAGWDQKTLESTPMASADPITKKIRSLPTRIINFQACYPEHVIDSSAYALAFIDTPTSQTRTLLMGSDDGLKVWLNGRCIHNLDKDRPIIPDEDLAIAKFRPGINIILVQVTNAKGYWGFMLRMHSSKGPAPSMMLPDIGGLIK